NDVGENPDYRTDPSTGLGMPLWVNHVSFRMSDRAAWEAFRDHLKSQNVMMVAETDHDFCHSLYVIDPNMLMIEFTFDTDLEKFGMTQEAAYQALFETPPEDIPAEAYKGSRNPKVKLYV
ncbi:MAG: VOC family protein, partial [Moraxellaceae bacterium]|nr:VOC family protein [Moraxellaceae bacterium]